MRKGVRIMANKLIMTPGELKKKINSIPVADRHRLLMYLAEHDQEALSLAVLATTRPLRSMDIFDWTIGGGLDDGTSPEDTAEAS
jgi:hypothetical protein